MAAASCCFSPSNERTVLIVDATPQGGGWFPINHMVALAGRLFEADVKLVEAGRRAPWHKRIPPLIRRRGATAAAAEDCLLICASPADLLQLAELPGWRERFRFVAAWVIDSFWLEWIPRSLRLTMPFDHLFVTRGEDIDDWYRAVGLRPSWLPWGADVLALGCDAADRPWDLLRVGRQPEPWEDDEATAAAAAALSLRFHPRPSELSTGPLANQRALMKAYGASKFMLAFSNLSHPTTYTHPTRDYITGRWVDALAAGACVAGSVPRGAMVDSLLWPEATLELGTTDRDEGLLVIADAVARWTPEVARTNHTRALERLDWRHRFAAIAEAFDHTPANLAQEIALLRDVTASNGA